MTNDNNEPWDEQERNIVLTSAHTWFSRIKTHLARISMPFSVSVRIKTNRIPGQEISEMLAEAMRLSVHVRRGSLHRVNPKCCYVLSTVSSTSLFDSVEAVVGHFAKKSRDAKLESSSSVLSSPN